MKRKLLSIMLVAAAVGSATAQEVTTTTTVSTQEAVTVVSDSSILKASTACDFAPVSHWSIGLKGGGNYFRVAPGSVSRRDQFNWVGGAAIEYSINPLVGLGVEYMYNPYGHTYQLNANQIGTMEGRTHDVLMYASINLMNLLVPNRTKFWSKMNIYGDAGVGVGFYQFKLMDAANNVIVDSRDAGDGVPETVMGKLGLNLEYNISKSIALGGEVQYRYYDRTNLGGYQMTKGNSDALTATIGLRFKLGANGQKQHARNISMCEYYPKPAPVIINKIVKDNTVETMDRLKAIEAENAALNNKINKLNNQVDSLSANEDEANLPTYENIEFEFGSDQLTQGSYRALDQIAATLKNDNSTVRLNIAGYTDYVGTNEFNQDLSERRANAVKRYLLSKNVPSSSVTIVGYGEKDPIAPNNTSEGRELNRRVEFQLSK